MKKILLFLVLVLGIGVLGFWYISSNMIDEGSFVSDVSDRMASVDPGTNQDAGVVEKKVTVGGVQVMAEIADSTEKRTKGLSERSRLEPGHGMLFVFDRENVTSSFWMKGMEFPIDFVWIDDMEVVQTYENAQPHVEGESVRLYVANQPFDYVLEVNAGWVGENNIKAGDPVVIEASEPSL